MAVAFSFFLYAASFEPWGIAECAYVFAVPAILAARSLFSEIPAPKPPETAVRRRRRSELDFPEIPASGEGVAPQAGARALWLISTFAFSYAAWAAMLAWLRHVYPPGGLDCRSAFASYNIGIIRVAVVCVAAQVPARPARRPREKAAALWRNRGRVGMPRMAEGAYVYGVPVAAARAFAVAQARGNPDGRIRWGMDCIVHRHIFQPRRRGIHMAPLCAAEIQYITQLFRAPAVR